MNERGDGTGYFKTTSTDAAGNRSMFKADLDKEGKVVVNTIENDSFDARGNKIQRWEMTSDDGAYICVRILIR